jgi:hypothetical protein
MEVIQRKRIIRKNVMEKCVVRVMEKIETKHKSYNPLPLIIQPLRLE